MTTTQTAGQKLTTELRRYFHIGARTRWGRKGSIGRLTRDDVMEEIEMAAALPGCHSERVTEIFAPAAGTVRAWRKHIDSYRSNAVLCTTLLAMSPWEFSAYLGRMLDTGYHCVGQFEIWFSSERERLASAAVAA